MSTAPTTPPPRPQSLQGVSITGAMFPGFETILTPAAAGVRGAVAPHVRPDAPLAAPRP